MAKQCTKCGKTYSPFLKEHPDCKGRMDKDKRQLHYYCVTGVLPPTADRKWRMTKRWGVVASTPELAGMQVRLNNEGVQVDSIQHRGVVDSFHECEEFVKEMLKC